MQKSNAPVQYVIPWSNSGTKNTIPVASQIGITNGAASFTDGYPPLTFTPIASGGVPPFGADTNGILFDVTLTSLWQQSGFVYAYNSTFNTNQGGYPAQALLARSDGKGFWLNLTDNNTTNPDATSPTGWASVRANIGSTSIAVVNGNNTPDPSTLGFRLLTITGSISSTASLILPLTAGASWVIQNSTSGAGSLSVQGATGSGVTVAQGIVSEVITDGTNFYTSTFNGAGVYLPINGTAVAATKLATARTIAMTGDVAWTSPAFDGTSNVTAVGTIQPASVTLSKMANFQANSLMGNPTVSSTTPSAITLNNGLLFSGSSLGLGAITPSSVTTNAVTGTLFGCYFGGTGTQEPMFRMGWNNAITRVAQYLEADASFSLYSYDGSGALIQRLMNITPLGVTTVTGVVNSFGGSVSSQQICYRLGWNNNVGRIAQVLETDASFSMYSYDSSGVIIGSMLKITPAGNLTAGGSVTCTTLNATSSDARLKKNIVKVDPQPLHRGIPFWKYDRKDVDISGRGPMAQDVKIIAPVYMGDLLPKIIDGEMVDTLTIDKPGLAYEQSMWAGFEIDKLTSRVESMERFLSETMRY